MNRPRILLLAATLAVLAGCQREDRRLREAPPYNAPATGVRVSELVPGQEWKPQMVRNPYEDNAYMANEGKSLFDQYNCSGCHFHGGGGIGPPLIDQDWIYGSNPEQIYSTIVEGRPNGMPSFRGKIPDFQVWELVAYVRSMSGQLPVDVAPSRGDHMAFRKPENETPEEHPTTEHPATIKPEQKPKEPKQ